MRHASASVSSNPQNIFEISHFVQTLARSVIDIAAIIVKRAFAVLFISGKRKTYRGNRSLSLRLCF